MRLPKYGDFGSLPFKAGDHAGTGVAPGPVQAASTITTKNKESNLPSMFFILLPISCQVIVDSQDLIPKI